MRHRPQVSFVLATHNRRQITLDTLQQLLGEAGPCVPYEVIVVDNASADGTADAVRSRFGRVKLLAGRRNLGSCAKALGVEQARGRFVVFLDDDSYPRPGSVDRMLDHFARHPRLAGAGFRIHLPDGTEECSALPNVFVGCGVGLRADALRQVGGLDHTLFMQAEEYDLSFRLINAGWEVRTFDDLHVDHLKTACARRGSRTVYYDTRNNLLVAARYLPDPYYRLYRDDWLRRYAWLATHDGRRAAWCRGALAGWLGALGDRRRFADRRLNADAFETLLGWRFVAERMGRLASDGVRRVLLAGLGKNVLAFERAAAGAAVSVLAMGDDRFARPGRHYRDIPIMPLKDALALNPDAVVVGDTSPVHADRTAATLGGLTDLPVHCWFTRRQPAAGHPSASDADIGSTTPQSVADKNSGHQVAPVPG